MKQKLDKSPSINQSQSLPAVNQTNKLALRRVHTSGEKCTATQLAETRVNPRVIHVLQRHSNMNWRAPWKERTCSTTMKLRKSLVKPVTRQDILSCSVLLPEIVMHDALSVILWTSADICIVHDDLGWKNRTTRYNCRFSAASLALWMIFSGRTTEQHVISGFEELAAVD